MCGLALRCVRIALCYDDDDDDDNGDDDDDNDNNGDDDGDDDKKKLKTPENMKCSICYFLKRFATKH